MVGIVLGCRRSHTCLGVLGAVSYFGTGWVFAGIVSAAVMAGFLWVTWPDYPTAEDVERDRGFRRSHGLLGEGNDARH